MIVLLFGLWIVFNGNFTIEIAVFGVVFALAIFGFMVKFMNYSVKKELLVYRLIPCGLLYFLVLLWEIVKANLVMLTYVFGKKSKQDPVIVTFEPELRSELAKVILANSITLTPGTYTVGIDEKKLKVHCLTRKFSIEIESSVFVKQLKKMEKIALGE